MNKKKKKCGTFCEYKKKNQLIRSRSRARDDIAILFQSINKVLRINSILKLITVAFIKKNYYILFCFLIAMQCFAY